MSIQNRGQISNCTVCQSRFLKKSWNSKVCSDICRKMKEQSAKKRWHFAHRQSENIKSRRRQRLYSNDEKKAIYRRFRSRRGLPYLQETICAICYIEFLPKTHNAKTCSSDCRNTLKQQRNKKYFKDRYSKDLNFRLASILRNRVNKLLKKNHRSDSVIAGLGCSIEDLKEHLKAQFQPGMTWYNYGEWHIDHIEPLSGFDLANEDEFKAACHYSNLQPLWAKDNLSKGSKRGEE